MAEIDGFQWDRGTIEPHEVTRHQLASEIVDEFALAGNDGYRRTIGAEALAERYRDRVMLTIAKCLYPRPERPEEPIFPQHLNEDKQIAIAGEMLETEQQARRASILEELFHHQQRGDIEFQPLEMDGFVNDFWDALSRQFGQTEVDEELPVKPDPSFEEAAGKYVDRGLSEVAFEQSVLQLTKFFVAKQVMEEQKLIKAWLAPSPGEDII